LASIVTDEFLKLIVSKAVQENFDHCTASEIAGVSLSGSKQRMKFMY